MATHNKIISSRQIKAARALLDWSQDILAEKSGLSIATIRKVEAGNTSPRRKTNNHIRNAIESAGLEFIEPKGVRHRPEEIVVYNDINGAEDFYANVFHHADKYGGEILIVSPDSTELLNKVLKDSTNSIINKMDSIKHKITARCIQTSNRTSVAAPSFCEYRFLSSSLIDSVHYFVYGDNISFKTFSDGDIPKIIEIKSHELSNQYRKQFYSMWEKAVPINTPNKETR